MSQPVEQLINEVRLLYQSLVLVGNEIHADSNITMGMRAVLEYLDRNGNATVPHIARERRVSRQRIQALVNPLVELDLVQSITNPASKRSPLITLSKAGEKTILEMRRLEGRHLRVGLGDERILEAARTLAEFRDALEGGKSSGQRVDRNQKNKEIA
jgi:DNA-binding MarR family transcriptional regulator